MIRPGQQLGPYEIVSLLASGGMGEVYRARDPRLERDVALKVVRSSLPVHRWDWPLMPGRGRQHAIEYVRPYACNSVSIDAAGSEVLIPAPAEAGLLASLEGGPVEQLVRVPPSAPFDRRG